MIICRSCENRKLVKTLNLGKYYLSDFLSKPRKVKAFPLDLAFCTKCKLLQLAHTTPTKYLYSKRYGYKSGINDSMKTILSGIVEMILKKIHLYSGDVVVDIGCNDKTLLSYYPKNLIKIGFDPVTKFKINFKGGSEILVNNNFN